MIISLDNAGRRLHKRFIYIAKMTVFILGLVFVFFQTPTAEAHSTLLEMEPAERVVIEEPPSTLSLRFNEPIEHDLAVVTIYDWNAKLIFTGNPDGDIERAPLLVFSIPELAQGTYTVKWNVISVDGHPTTDSYAFSVGEATKGDVMSVAADNGAGLGLIVARIITESLLLLGPGVFWFGWLAKRRKFPSLEALWKKGRRIGASLIVLGTVAELLMIGTL